MQHDDAVYLGHMLDAARKAIISMRHKVVHDYMDLNEDVIWDTTTTDLPELISQLEKIVST